MLKNYFFTVAALVTVAVVAFWFELKKPRFAVSASWQPIQLMSRPTPTKVLQEGKTTKARAHNAREESFEKLIIL